MDTLVSIGVIASSLVTLAVAAAGVAVAVDKSADQTARVAGLVAAVNLAATAAYAITRAV